MTSAVYLNIAPDLCAPCRDGKHQDCGWDGEPDCLCTEHPIPVRTFGPTPPPEETAVTLTDDGEPRDPGPLPGIPGDLRMRVLLARFYGALQPRDGEQMAYLRETLRLLDDAADQHPEETR